MQRNFLNHALRWLQSKHDSVIVVAERISAVYSLDKIVPTKLNNIFDNVGVEFGQ